MFLSFVVCFISHFIAYSFATTENEVSENKNDKNIMSVFFISIILHKKEKR